MHFVVVGLVSPESLSVFGRLMVESGRMKFGRTGVRGVALRPIYREGGRTLGSCNGEMVLHVACRIG